jgi:polyphosphate kinase
MVIKNLIDAARNGKQVHVVLELQARFDEQNNLEWAKVLTDAGVHVSFGVNQLKVHAKICRIVREEKHASRQYCYIGTGNFHEKTARIYTDFGLFTANPDVCSEVAQVFQFIEAPYKRFNYRNLWVSPRTQRREIYQRIDREIANAQKGLFARVRAKVNNLVDEGLIEKLYQASQAGVKVQMIIRGMCSLVPGVKGLSENIKVISVIDRFLEHPRLCEFENAGSPEVFISSADWMKRNLDRRIEVATRIVDPELAGRIMHLFDIQWGDRAKARLIDADQSNQYVPRGNRKKLRSQHKIYEVVSNWDQDLEK